MEKIIELLVSLGISVDKDSTEETICVLLKEYLDNKDIEIKTLTEETETLKNEKPDLSKASELEEKLIKYIDDRFTSFVKGTSFIQKAPVPKPKKDYKPRGL